MNTNSSFGWFRHFTILHCAVVVLVALAWSDIAYCGAIHDAADRGDLQTVKALLKANTYLVSERGYAIFVRQGQETFRVRKFDADKNVYIIGSTPTEEIPIAETRATTVGRSAGG
jgi:hypothetical protein